MINWVNITLLVFVLMLWATVAWGIAVFLIGQSTGALGPIWRQRS